MSSTTPETSFLDDVLAEGTRGPDCTVKSVLTTIEAKSPALADQVRQALAHPTAKGSVIARKLRALGYSISDGTVQRHRAGDCRCGRRAA